MTAAVFLALTLVPLPSAGVGNQGWTYLIDKLLGDGVDREQVIQAFNDPRMPPFIGVDFSLARPHEPRSLYRRFLRWSSIISARRCRLQHADDFELAARSFSVPANVLAAILFVESGCGRNTGSHPILPRLARLAMANEPENLQRNLARFAASDGTLDPSTDAQVRARARYLEDTFYPEVRATFAVANRFGVKPLDIRGSTGGAFGYPQFLPSSYLRHGTDGDGDGRVSLYDTADAAASTANYLVGHGWHPGLTAAQRRAVIWQYNRSEAYVDTVLALSARIDGVPTTTGKTGKHARGGTRKKKDRPRSAQRARSPRRG